MFPLRQLPSHGQPLLWREVPRDGFEFRRHLDLHGQFLHVGSISDHLGHCVSKVQTTMKNLFTLLFTFVAVSAVTQGIDPNRYKNGMPHHPFRKIGQKYFDLRKLYEWDQAQSNLRVGEIGTSIPLKDWIGDDHGGSAYKVSSVLKEGLLIEKRNFGNPYGEPFLLVNYPMEKSAVDGQTIRFFAMRSGQFKYWDKTVERYDYGIPYDPLALKAAADSQKTNTSKAK